MTILKVDSLVHSTAVEEDLLESVLATLISKDGGATTAHAFLEANSEHEPCQKLLQMWNQYVFLPHCSNCRADFSYY